MGGLAVLKLLHRASHSLLDEHRLPEQVQWRRQPQEAARGDKSSTGALRILLEVRDWRWAHNTPESKFSTRCVCDKTTAPAEIRRDGSQGDPEMR